MLSVMLPLDLQDGLRAFGLQDFRAGQREAIETLVARRRLLLVAPTGGGKSLVYQLPALLLPGTTLVISPLIALMADQVRALDARRLPATYLASTLSAEDMRQRLENMAAGAYRLVYVSPERLGSASFRSRLTQMQCPLVAVDEAHCISEWGHDFRPEYMQIGALLRSFPNAAVLACTATATPIVRDEILARLGLEPDTPQLLRGFARPNLALRVLETSGVRDREHHVDAILLESLGSCSNACGSAIVYAPTRKQVEAEATRLKRQGWRVMAYHAGMGASTRDTVSRRFTESSIDVVVATNAFGMGIDRADVRMVAHLGPPGSIEAYYQEVGRAGRDGARAYGLMLTSARDLPLRRKLLETAVDGVEPDPRIVEHKWGLFLELMRWAEGGTCRHDAILRYFGDHAEVLAGCGICDVCEHMSSRVDVDLEDVTLIVRKALSAVARIHGRLGLSAAIKLLHGGADARLVRYELVDTKTFGTLSGYSEAWIGRLLRRCVTAGWVSFSSDDKPVAALTLDGREVMYGRRPANILLPDRGDGPIRERPGPSRKPEPTTTLDDGLFEALRVFRLQRSREEQVPPFVVASDRTLRDIAATRPKTLNQLLGCHGIGPAKADKYGEGFLRVVSERGVS